MVDELKASSVNLEESKRKLEGEAATLKTSVGNLEEANSTLVAAAERYLLEMNSHQQGTCNVVTEMHQRVKDDNDGTGWFDLNWTSNVVDLMKRDHGPFRKYEGPWPKYGSEWLCPDDLIGRCNNKRSCGRCAKGLHVHGSLIPRSSVCYFVSEVEWRMNALIGATKRAIGN